jgi:hypothetical protein
MALNGGSITAKIEHPDHPSTVRTGLSAKDAADIVRALEGEADVTVTMSMSVGENLSIAVDHAWVFLGLERIDGVFQYVSSADECTGTQQFRIGGQEVYIDSRYVSPVTTAANVVEEWFKDGEGSSFGYWERQ